MATQNFGWVGHNAFVPINNWPVCSLILRKISKICVTRFRILRLKCAKFAFRSGSVPDPVGGAYNAPPDHIAVFKGPTSKGGRGGEKKGREDEWMDLAHPKKFAWRPQWPAMMSHNLFNLGRSSLLNNSFDLCCRE